MNFEKRQPASDLGYILAPARRPSEPGHAWLEVHITQEPSERHFDPRLVELTAAAAPGQGTLPLIVSHPWVGQAEYQACAGPVNLISQRGGQVDIFTYGGELTIQGDEAQTSLRLESPAPLVVRAGYLAPATLLMEESEIILAERRASHPDEDAFEQRLAAAEPLALYLAMLKAIQAKYQELPHDGSDWMVKFRHMLKAEIEAAEALHPGLLSPEIEKML